MNKATRISLFIVGIVFIILAFAMPAKAEIEMFRYDSINASDTLIRNCGGGCDTTNYGTNGVIAIKRVGSGDAFQQRSLMDWNKTVANIPTGSTIDTVTLELSAQTISVSGKEILLYPIKTSWIDTSATWANFGGQDSHLSCDPNVPNGGLNMTDYNGSFLLGSFAPTTVKKYNVSLDPSWYQHMLDDDGWLWRDGIILRGLDADECLGTDWNNQFHSSDAVTESDRPALYIEYTEAAGSPIFSWTSPPTPADGQINNTYTGVNISASCTLNGVVNLYWNGTITTSAIDAAHFVLNSSIVPNDAEYNYWGNCDTEANETARGWTLDTYTPIISLNSNNGFTAQNVTEDIYSSVLLLNVTVQEDRSLFAFQVNISNSSGSVFLYTNNTLSGTMWNFSKVVNVSSFGPGEYNVNFMAADSHTKGEIKDYVVLKTKDILEFHTTEGIQIKVKSNSKSDTAAIRKKDRYEMVFVFDDKEKKKKGFTLTSSVKLAYIPKSIYPAHFVAWNGRGGNWIDFAGEDIEEIDYTVSKVSDYEYIITFDELGGGVIFHSIGGLNIAESNYIYTHSSLSIDSVTITPSNPIITEDLLGYAVASEGLGFPGFFNWAWYTNGSFYDSGASGNLTPGVAVNLANISNNLTNYGGNWTFSAQWNTMGNSTDWLNSSIAIINLQALNVTIKDEDTGNLISENVTVVVTGSSSETTVYTATGSISIGNLQNGENSFSFSGPSYNQRTYIVTLSNLTQTLTAYLATNTSKTTFTVKDSNSGISLENVTSTMYRLIGSAWTPVESRYTDITGKVVFNYLPNKYYRFILGKSGYDSKIFFLNPVLFSSYDVFLDPTSTITSTQDFDMVSIMWAPDLVYDGIPTNFTFLVQSPQGILVNYGYTISYPGGTDTSSGTNAIGSQLQDTFTTVGGTSLDRVQIDYYYTSSIDGIKEFTAYIPISTNVSSLTLAAQKDEHYGMGLFERLFWVTIILLLAVGIPSSLGKPLVGGVLGLFVIGVLMRTGFLEVWLGLFPIFVGLIFLSSQGGR